jgi:hypothetical protein
MVKKDSTRKHTRASDALTIPQLKQAFDYIEDFASSRPDIKIFLKEWKKVFGRPLEEEQGRAYIEFISKSNKRILRSHRGGSMLDTSTGQGMIPGQVTETGLKPYGAFPTYVSSGFEVGIPEPASRQACALGVGGLGPQDGGARAAAAAARKKRTLRRLRGGRIPFSTAPPSFMQNAATAWRGQPLPPSSSPIDNRINGL